MKETPKGHGRYGISLCAAGARGHHTEVTREPILRVGEMAQFACAAKRRKSHQRELNGGDVSGAAP